MKHGEIYNQTQLTELMQQVGFLILGIRNADKV